MSYRNASKLAVTPAWGALSPDERLAEQAAALDLVAKFGGNIEFQCVLWSDGVILSVTTYPDLASACKAEMAIGARGAFQLQSQAALTLDELLGFQSAIAAV